MKQELLALVGSAEKQSEHPLAQAIVEGVQEKLIELKTVTSFEKFLVMGLKPMWTEKRYWLVHAVYEKIQCDY